MRGRSLNILAAGVLILTACAGRPTPAPTALPSATLPAAATTTLVPAQPSPITASDTPVPTPTLPPPTASATPLVSVATATTAASPTVPATPDPSEAVGDVIYQDKLDGTSGWFWNFSDDVVTFTVTSGKLKGVMQKANSGWRFSVGPDKIQAGSQQVRLSAHMVACGPNDEYGLNFRVKPDPATSHFNMYLFKLRCGGAASFGVVHGITVTTIVDWTPSPAIRTGAGADNTLMVWAAGSEFRFYANDQYLFSAQDSSLTSGFYGIYLADRTAGGLTVNFDNLVARAVNK